MDNYKLLGSERFPSGIIRHNILTTDGVEEERKYFDAL